MYVKTFMENVSVKTIKKYFIVIKKKYFTNIVVKCFKNILLRFFKNIYK